MRLAVVSSAGIGRASSCSIKHICRFESLAHSSTHGDGLPTLTISTDVRTIQDVTLRGGAAVEDRLPDPTLSLHCIDSVPYTTDVQLLIYGGSTGVLRLHTINPKALYS